MLTLNCVVVVYLTVGLSFIIMTLNSTVCDLQRGNHNLDLYCFSDVDSNGSPRWNEPDLEGCRSMYYSNITARLENLVNTHITEGKLVNLLF